MQQQGSDPQDQHGRMSEKDSGSDPVQNPDDPEEKSKNGKMSPNSKSKSSINQSRDSPSGTPPHFPEWRGPGSKNSDQAEADEKEENLPAKKTFGAEPRCQL